MRSTRPSAIAGQNKRNATEKRMQSPAFLGQQTDNRKTCGCVSAGLRSGHRHNFIKTPAERDFRDSGIPGKRETPQIGSLIGLEDQTVGTRTAGCCRRSRPIVDRQQKRAGSEAGKPKDAGSARSEIDVRSGKSKSQGADPGRNGASLAESA